jgi:hypothetical protein
MKNILFIFIVSSIAVIGCNKGNVAGKQGNRWEMLVNKHWYVSTIEENNMPYKLKECERDNYYVFTYEDQGRVEEGVNNCYSTGNGMPSNDTVVNDSTIKPNIDRTKTYTSYKWEMPGDQREIHIWDLGFAGSRREWKIENMDFTHLDVRSVEQYNGKLYVYNIHLITQ